MGYGTDSAAAFQALPPQPEDNITMDMVCRSKCSSAARRDNADAGDGIARDSVERSWLRNTTGDR